MSRNHALKRARRASVAGDRKEAESECVRRRVEIGGETEDTMDPFFITCSLQHFNLHSQGWASKRTLAFWRPIVILILSSLTTMLRTMKDFTNLIAGRPSRHRGFT